MSGTDATARASARMRLSEEATQEILAGHPVHLLRAVQYLPMLFCCYVRSSLQSLTGNVHASCSPYHALHSSALQLHAVQYSPKDFCSSIPRTQFA
eukprot:3267749-Rhodomonas_salina.2